MSAHHAFSVGYSGAPITLLADQTLHGNMCTHVYARSPLPASTSCYDLDSNPCRHMRPEDEEALRAAVQAYFPAANGRVLAHSACLFTNTLDGHFVIDQHPYHPQVTLVSACRYELNYHACHLN
jgi:glycine/D-amino acid oxidase-like deaminating enzyme